MLVGGVDVMPMRQHASRRIVQFIVKERSAPVLNGILDAGDDDDEDERECRDTCVGGTKDRETLD